MTDECLISANFDRAEKFSSKRKIVRWTSRPFHHLVGFVYSYLIYELVKRPLFVRKRLFNNSRVVLPLPSSLDIFLTGIKPFPAEVRLSKWAIRTNRMGSVIFDIGAHIGFYTILFEQMLEGEGKVIAFEPTSGIRKILITNTAGLDRVYIEERAVSDHSGICEFYDLPVKYSESNGLEEVLIPANFRGSVVKKQIECTTVDDYVKLNKLIPTFIKMDVEGHESKVIRGAEFALKTHKPLLSMEVHRDKYNELYSKGVELLLRWNYLPYRIEWDGSLEEIKNIGHYIAGLPYESDNIMFVNSSSG